MFIILLAVTLVFLLSLYWYSSKGKNLPPGPIGIPILGYLPQFAFYGSTRHLHFNKLSQKFGDIFMFRLTFRNVLVINSFEAFREAFVRQGDSISDRGLHFVREYITMRKGVITNDGETQREQRRFAMRVLRDCGFGKIASEEIISQEAKFLHEKLKQFEGQVFDVANLFSEATANMIGSILYGERLEYGSTELKYVTKIIHKVGDIPSSILLLNFNPWLAPLRNYMGINKFIHIRSVVSQYLHKYVQEHRERLNPDDLSDFLFTYLHEMQKYKGTSKAADWDDDQLIAVIIDLMIAGTDTTKQTMVWALLCLSSNEKIQDQMRSEIVDILGPTQMPSTRDLQRLPFSEACFLEVLRFSTIAATGVPRCCSNSMTLNGYHIPKGTIVIPNLYAMHFDKKTWKNPNAFDPASNFLQTNADGSNNVINRDKIVAFGAGRRSCMGESLARMEVWIYLISTIQRFKISLPKNVVANFNANIGVLRAPTSSSFVFQAL